MRLNKSPRPHPGSEILVLQQKIAAERQELTTLITDFRADLQQARSAGGRALAAGIVILAGTFVLFGLGLRNAGAEHHSCAGRSLGWLIRLCKSALSVFQAAATLRKFASFIASWLPKRER